MDEAMTAVIKRLDDEDTRQNKRLEVLEDKVEKLNDIALSIKELTINMGHMVETQKSMQTDIEEMKAKPGKAADKLAWIVITAIVGILVGFIFAHLGF